MRRFSPAEATLVLVSTTLAISGWLTHEWLDVSREQAKLHSALLALAATRPVRVSVVQAPRAAIALAVTPNVATPANGSAVTLPPPKRALRKPTHRRHASVEVLCSGADDPLCAEL